MPEAGASPSDGTVPSTDLRPPPPDPGADPATERTSAARPAPAEPTEVRPHRAGPAPAPNPAAATAEASAPATPGSRWGRFEILGELGRGGMGVVYRARDPALGRLVAVKAIAADAAGAEAPDRSRFRVEARAAARLRHPGIVQVHEVGELDGRPYLVMEFVEGRTLDAFLAASGGSGPSARRDLREAARLVRDVAEAIAYAHDQGVLHRDLKPENILVDSAGRACVTDFGLARETANADATRLTAHGSLMGTPSYMSPEQARGETDGVDARTDVWGNQ